MISYSARFQMIIRYRTSISYTMSPLYDIACIYRQKRTPIPYDVAYNIATYDVTYDIACLGRRSRRVSLAMPLERPQVLPHDPRPSRMVCTASSQSWRPFPQSGMCDCRQCEWWQPCTSKNRNFKLKSGGIAGDPVALRGQMTEW